MSIIDWLLLFIACGLGAALFLIGLIIVAIVRWWMNRLNADDAIEKSAPRVRTRLQQPADWNGEVA